MLNTTLVIILYFLSHVLFFLFSKVFSFYMYQIIVLFYVHLVVQYGVKALELNGNVSAGDQVNHSTFKCSPLSRPFQVQE